MSVAGKIFQTGAELLAYCEERSQGFQGDEKERGVDEGLGLFSVHFRGSQPDEGQGILDALRAPRFLEHLPQLTGLSWEDEDLPASIVDFIATGAVELLQTGRISSGFDLRFKLPDINFGDADKHVLALAEALKSGKCPAGLTLNLTRNHIGPEGAQALTEALKSGKCSVGLALNLGSNNIGDAGARVLAEALKSGLCPAGLTLTLGHNDIGPEGAQALAEALKSGQCPAGLTLNLSINKIGPEGAQALADALSSGCCSEGLTLNLGNNSIGPKGTQALADALSTGQCSEGLTLGLYGNHIGDVGACALADALKSGQCPTGLTLDLSHNYIGDAGAKHLADALASGECPAGLTLDLRVNGIGDAGACALAVALASGKCPEGLTLSLGWCDISDAGASALAEALEQGLAEGHLPPGLKIDLSPDKISAGPLARINRVLEKNNQLGLMQAVFCAEQFIKNKNINSAIYDQNVLSEVVTFLAPAAVRAQKPLHERVDEYSRLRDKAIKARPAWLKDGMTPANCTYDYWLGVRLINEDEKGSVSSLEDEFSPFINAEAYNALKAQVSWYKAWDRIPLIGKWIHRLFNFFNFNQCYRHEILFDFYKYKVSQNKAKRPLEEKSVLDGSPPVEQSQVAGAAVEVPPVTLYRELVEARNNELNHVTNPEANNRCVQTAGESESTNRCSLT